MQQRYAHAAKARGTGLLAVTLILGLCCRAGLSGSTANAPSRTLTLADALKIALKKNLTVQAARNRVLLSKKTAQQKKTAFGPSLSLSLSTAQRYMKKIDPASGDYLNAHSGSLNLSLSASLNLFNGFYDVATLKQARQNLEKERLDLSRSQQGLVVEVLQKYVQVVVAGEWIAVQNENLASQKLLLARIEDFVKAGSRAITDLYQQKAQIASYEYQLLESQRQLTAGKLALSEVLGLEPGTGFSIKKPAVSSLIAALQKDFEKGDIQNTLRIRPDARAAELAVAAARQDIRKAAAGYWPRVSLYSDLASNYVSGANGNFSNQILDYNPSAAVGISVQVPVFDRGQTSLSVASARIALKNSELTQKQLNHRIRVEFQEAFDSYRTAKKQVAVAAAQLEYAGAALESIWQRYNVGAATLTEFSQARAQNLQARYDKLQASFSQLLKGVDVLFSRGDLRFFLSHLTVKTD